MGALYSLKEFGTGIEIEQRWFPAALDPKSYVSDPNNPAGKAYMVLLNANAPEPLSPDDELDAVLASLKGTGATTDQLIDALRGQSGKKGRIAGRT